MESWPNTKRRTDEEATDLIVLSNLSDRPLESLLVDESALPFIKVTIKNIKQLRFVDKEGSTGTRRRTVGAEEMCFLEGCNMYF